VRYGVELFRRPVRRKRPHDPRPSQPNYPAGHQWQRRGYDTGPNRL